MSELIEDTSEGAQALSQALMEADAKTDLQIAQSRGLLLATGALIVGLGAGSALGYVLAKRQLEKLYAERADEEIAEMREHYRQKAVALEGEAGKRDTVDKIVKDRGYSPEEDEEEQTTPPMAVTPPAAVTDRAQEIAESEDEAAGEPPDDEDEAPTTTQNVFEQHQDTPDEWNWHKERSNRSPLRPFVIHREERDENEAYDAVTYTYYEQDDVVCDERDEVLDAARREEVIGEENLSKFGHGSGDPTVVYVRNPQLEMDMEICLSHNSYAEEVHGLEPEIKHSHRRRGGRASFDDD